MKICSISSTKHVGAKRESVSAKPLTETYSGALCDIRGEAFANMTIHQPREDHQTKLGKRGLA